MGWVCTGIQYTRLDYVNRFLSRDIGSCSPLTILTFPSLIPSIYQLLDAALKKKLELSTASCILKLQSPDSETGSLPRGGRAGD